MKDIYDLCYVGEEANKKTAIDGLNNGDPAMEQFFNFSLYKGEYESEGSYSEQWDEEKGGAEAIYYNELGGGYDGGEMIQVIFSIKRVPIEG